MRLTEKSIINKLKQLYSKGEPFTITLKRWSGLANDKFRFDALGILEIGDRQIDIAIEIIPVANPMNLKVKTKSLLETLNSQSNSKLVPLIVAPYIGPKQKEILKSEGISWVDLCGNFRIDVPPYIYLEKTGNKNKFPDTAPIKKIFQGTSGLVCRALLLQKRGFESQSSLIDFINARNGKITNSTVSRVIKKLCDELLIIKDNSSIRVIDADNILTQLQLNYESLIKGQNEYSFTVAGEDKRFLAKIRSTIDYVLCGFYAAQLKGLAATDKISIAVKDVNQLETSLLPYNTKLVPDYEYGNLIIRETSEPGVWFNPSIIKNTKVVDDIELYLELMTDRPRGPNIAKILKNRILERFKDE